MHLARRYDEAIEQYQKTIELDEGFSLAHRRLAQTYEQKQMYTEAIAEFQTAFSLSGEDAELLSARGHLYAKLGETDKADEALRRLGSLAKCRYVPAYLVARVYLGLVFEWLRKACDERYGYLAYLNVDPIFDSIRQDQRFAELTRRIGLVESGET